MSVKDGKQIALTWDKNNEIILAIKCVLKICTKMFSTVKYIINYNFYFIRHTFTCVSFTNFMSLLKIV